MEVLTNTFAVTKTGSVTASGAASVSGTLPVGSDGFAPDYVLVQATAGAHIRFSNTAGPTALATDAYLAVGGQYRFRTISTPYFAVIQDAAAGNVFIVPLDI